MFLNLFALTLVRVRVCVFFYSRFVSGPFYAIFPGFVRTPARSEKLSYFVIFIYANRNNNTKRKDRARARNFPAIYNPIHKRFPPRFFFFYTFLLPNSSAGCTGHGEEGAEESESIYFLTPALLRARMYACLCVYRVFHPVHFTTDFFQLIFQHIDLSLLN